ncbi:MAG: RnfABCDGE type electron transport complex subunit D [Oscillospiraceae bacterium]|nr:RnfABCDGE type electron transport complex subunit D [Candidatus Equicaccousia limihippi]
MNNFLKVASSPHKFTKDNTQSIMLDVIIALVPIGILAVVMYGLSAAVLIAVTVATCVLSEYIWCRILKKPNEANDLSAIVTGLLLAYSLPPKLPVWMAMIGGVIAIIVIKQMFGGIGHNFANPAVCARIVLMVSFTQAMTSWYFPFTNAVSSATPLVQEAANRPADLNLFLGNYQGCIGETSALLILIGGLYLVLRRVINPIIPLSFIGSAFVLTWIITGNFNSSVLAILSGALLLGAVFMATDYVTSPTTNIGKLIFGIGCGFITVLIRQFGNMPEGVSFAILIMNLLVPAIEKIPDRRAFGEKEGK